MPGEIAVCSIDHGLREEAADEVALVKALCANLQVPFTAQAITVEQGNLQANGRAARYAALERWATAQNLDAVATAHHADDQAETVLMRLARGSGLSGLSGIRAATHLPDSNIALIRPLLGVLKVELEACVRLANVTPARDPSNADRSFDRVRMRFHLAEQDWLDAEPLAASAAHLAQSWEALEWYAERDWESNVSALGTTYRYVALAPRAIQVEVLRRIISELGGEVIRSEAGRAADRLSRGENASLGGVLAVCETRKDAHVWRFSPEPPRNQS